MPRLARSTTSGAARLESLWRAKAGGHVISMRWRRDGGAIAAATADGPIVIFDANSGRSRLVLPGHRNGTAQVDWRPGADSVLASVGCDGCVRLWDGHREQELDAGGAWAERVAWSPDGAYLAVAAGRRLRIWDMRRHELACEFEDSAATIADIGWKPGEECLLASCGYNGVSFWKPGCADRARFFEWKGSMLALAWSPDGRYIATGNQDATLQFWSLETGKELRMWGYPSKIRELAWDRRSRYLASGGAATVVVWDCSGKGPAGSKPVLLDFHARLISQLAFQRRGDLLASGCQEGLVALWRPGQRRKPVGTAAVEGTVTQLDWCPDDRRLAVATADGDVAMLVAS